MSIPIPPPHEPIADKDGRMNDVWYKFLEQNIREVNNGTTEVIPVSRGGTGQITAPEAVGELIEALTEDTAPVSTTDYLATYDASGDTGAKIPLSYVVLNRSSAVTLSTTAVDITGIPSGVNRLTVAIDGLSLDSTVAYNLQLGTSNGVVASGYLSCAISISTAGTAVSNSTQGFGIRNAGATRLWNGQAVVTRVTSHTWVASHTLGAETTGDMAVAHGGGSVPLGGQLDRIRLACTGGSFDAGQASVYWEF